MAEHIEVLRVLRAEDRYTALGTDPFSDPCAAARGKVDMIVPLVISACLAGSGSSRDAVAVGLDRRTPTLDIILAMERVVTPDDRFKAERLLDCLTYAARQADKSCLDVLPTVTEISPGAIMQRMRRLRPLLTMPELDEALVSYGGESIKAELSDIIDLTASPYADLDVVAGFRKLFQSLTRATDLSSSPPLFNQNATYTIFWADVVRRSPFMQSVTTKAFFYQPLDHLSRALWKLSWYRSGIESLLASYGRVLSSGGAPARFTWLESPSPTTMTLSDSAWDAIAQRARQWHQTSDERLAALRLQHPAVESRWSTRFATFPHPELRIILYLESVAPSLGRKSYIGKTKRICELCTRWLHEHNCSHNTRWRVSRDNGAFAPTWAAPGCPKADMGVMKDIERQLWQGLWQMSTGNTGTYPDHDMPTA